MSRKARSNVEDVFIRPDEDGYIADGLTEICCAEGTPYGIPICTREPVHDGPHVAHGEGHIMLA